MPSNTLLVRWAGGWTEVTDDDAIDAWGRREAMLSLGAVQSVQEAQRVATGQLAVFADVRTEVTCDIEPIGDADTPYVSFRVGDTVTVPDSDGTPTVERVRAITFVRDEDGEFSWTPELKDRILGDRERDAVALKKMDNGTLRGQSIVASPVSSRGATGSDTCCTPTVPDAPPIG